MKRINFPWTDGRDVDYQTYEPNPTHIESSGQGKTRPVTSNPLKVWRQIAPPRTPHGMSECSGQA